MEVIVKQALTAYSNWLNYDYHLHVTTRLAMNRCTEQQLNQTFIHEVLAPLSSYLGVRVAAISAITIKYTSQHAHSLLFSPDRTLTARDLNLFKSYMQGRDDHHHIFDHDNAIVAREHEIDRKSYVYDHLTRQDGSLHLYNRNLLRASLTGTTPAELTGLIPADYPGATPASLTGASLSITSTSLSITSTSLPNSPA